jgi:RimJ/RimL family protein N-acetyltransferase
MAIVTKKSAAQTTARKAAAQIRLVDIYDNERIVRGALRLLYRLLDERPAEANIAHSDMPTRAQHEYFVRRRPYRAWLMIQNPKGERVGALHLTHRNEIGIYILRKYRKKGYASAAILHVLETIEPLPGLPAIRRARYSANVAPHNAASLALFKKLGGTLLQVTYQF